MKPEDTKIDQARRKAQDQFTKVAHRDNEIRKDREKVQNAQSLKMARLRALRLAKEATEQAEAKANPAPAKKPAAVRKAKAAPKA